MLSRKADSKDNPVKTHIYKQLTMKSFNKDGFIEENLLEEFNAKEELSSEYLTQKGDIIVRLSVPYTSVLIDETTENLVIPSHFAVVKVKKNDILPEYLHWFLNTDDVKIIYSKNTGGNMIGAVRPSLIKEIDVKIPNLQMQEVMSQLNLLSIKEMSLIKKLEENKRIFIEKVLNEKYKEIK